jgi:DNA polymerase-1
MLSTSSIESASSATYSYGPQSVGAKLLINPDTAALAVPVVCSFDVETDGSQQQNFVGIAICPSLSEVWYFTELSSFVIKILTTSKLIGHGLKADLKFAKNAGVDIPFENIYADTQLMSYCIDSSKMKHGLKALCFENFASKWPTYEEMTENHKVSLAIQPVEKVANYCGRDALETLKLFNHLYRKMTEAQKRLHWNLELPETLILFLREVKGITVDVDYLKSLQARFEPELAHLEAHLINVGKDIGFKHQLKKSEVSEFNPNAPAQGVTFFNLLGIEVEDVAAQTMEPHYGHPVVDTFAEFKHLSKIKGTYVDSILEIESLPLIHTDFTQTVTMTGRLSSRDPNLQNIPSKGEYGDLIREMFVARDGMTFLDADFSNMELRVAAHFSQEPVWLEAFNNGKDVHQATADKIKKDRKVGKLFNLSVVYGVGSAKLAKSLGCTVPEADRQLADYWRGLPQLRDWIERTKRDAKRAGGVRTLLGRFIPYPMLQSSNKWQRFEAERQCVNAIVQGSSAEITKMSDVALYKAGVIPLLCVHDEHLIEVVDNSHEIERVSAITKDCMENSVKLSVPMIADLGVGKSWKKAKQ